MTTPHPISLSSDQLATLMDGAEHVPIAWRDRFLNDVADRLLVLDEISNNDAQAAVATTLARIGVAT
jgi:hypothetical protein